MGQLANTNTEYSASSLPSNTEKNPREHLKAITFRSKKQVETRVEENRESIEEDLSTAEKTIERSKEKKNEECP